MELSPNDQLHGFTVLTREELPEIDGTAYALSHRKSGARLLYLANDDANKAFSIAFKTPPADDTGVFHILEHSVLCGSDKFPVKEPFVDLLKSSMQTFLNAMTFPDKTLYPVASTNDQDLLNLADVYLDAVLHPAIYHKRAIFEQEGWHYELAADAEADEGDSIAGDVVAATEAEDGQARARAQRRGVQRDEGRALRRELRALRRAAGGAVPRHGLSLRVGRHAALHPRFDLRAVPGRAPRATTGWTTATSRCTATWTLTGCWRSWTGSTSPPWPTRKPPAPPRAPRPASRRSNRTRWRPRRPWWPRTWCATWTRRPRTPAQAWATS